MVDGGSYISIGDMYKGNKIILPDRWKGKGLSVSCACTLLLCAMETQVLRSGNMCTIILGGGKAVQVGIAFCEAANTLQIGFFRNGIRGLVRDRCTCDLDRQGSIRSPKLPLLHFPHP